MILVRSGANGFGLSEHTYVVSCEAICSLVSHPSEPSGFLGYELTDGSQDPENLPAAL